jgi:RNA-directed DNA polymerase
MRKRYPLNQSPLYKLHRRKDLAKLLGLTLRQVEEMADATLLNYRCFERVMQKDGKEKRRWIEWPKKYLQAVQRRLARLLDRVEHPDYIHSGFRGRSYITNALEHDCEVRLAKIDIRKFFPSASARCVARCFSQTFQCSPDVTAILTKLTTISGHLPTGGSTSPILSFYAYKPMFDEIHQLAAGRGLVMSCCVDDMTFSGEAATSGFLNEVRLIVARYGLNVHKRHCFDPSQTKVVTGVALTPRGVRLPNQRRQKLHDAVLAFNAEGDPRQRVKKGAQLLGRAVEAAQVEGRFEPLVRLAAAKLSEAKRARGA